MSISSRLSLIEQTRSDDDHNHFTRKVFWEVNNKLDPKFSALCYFLIATKLNEWLHNLYWKVVVSHPIWPSFPIRDFFLVKFTALNHFKSSFCVKETYCISISRSPLLKNGDERCSGEVLSICILTRKSIQALTCRSAPSLQIYLQLHLLSEDLYGHESLLVH